MKFNKKDFTVGQIVFLKLTGNEARGKSDEKLIVEREVKSIGNKFVTVGYVGEEYGTVKIKLEDGCEHSNYTSNYSLYLTKDDILDEFKLSKLTREIFGTFGFNKKLTLNQIERIYAIYKEQ